MIVEGRQRSIKVWNYMIKIFIVGDKLNTFSKNNNIFTYEQFKALFTCETKLESSNNSYMVFICQGLSDARMLSIYKLLKTSKGSERFQLANSDLMQKRASKKQTHKHKSQNVMISGVHQITDSQYLCHLMLDENCAEMSDHLTGQHIQGMVLVEATRQMVNAVSERYLIPEEELANKGFVLNSLNATFKEYLFPLNISLHMNILDLRKGLNGDFKAKCRIEIMQSEQVKLAVDVDFSVMSKSVLSHIESSMAKKLVEHSIDQRPELRLIDEQKIA